MTKPGTPLGEGERINLRRPTGSGIGIFYFDLEGATAEISEVRLAAIDGTVGIRPLNTYSSKLATDLPKACKKNAS